MTKKITKRERFEQIKAMLSDHPEIVEFCDHEIGLLAKKNAGDKKLTKEQEANLAIGEVILSTLEHGKTYTVSEIAKVCDLRNEAGDLLTTQKLSPICNRLVTDGKMVKTIDKRKTLFALAD